MTTFVPIVGEMLTSIEFPEAGFYLIVSVQDDSYWYDVTLYSLKTKQITEGCMIYKGKTGITEVLRKYRFLSMETVLDNPVESDIVTP